MKYGFAKVALISPSVRAGAVDFNKGEILKSIARAAEKKAELIVAGRLVLSGHSCGGAFFYGSLLQGCVDALASIVSATQSLSSLIVVGLPLKIYGKIYDCSAVIREGSVLAIVPNDNPDPVFSSFDSTKVDSIEINGREVPFGKNIIFYNTEMDYSLKFFDADCHLAHTELILRPLSAKMSMGSNRREAELCRCLSRENRCAVLSVSSSQTHLAGQNIFGGKKHMFELGENIALDEFGSDLLISEVDVGGISHAYTIGGARSKATQGADATYVTVNFAVNNNDFELVRRVSRYPLCPLTEEDCKDVIDVLTVSIKAKMQEAGHEKVIFGLSGGLDSTFLLLMCYKLFTREGYNLENIVAVTMNSSHTSSRTADNARKLIELLSVSSIDAPITNAVAGHLSELEHEEKDVVYENAQARQRALTLLNLANKHSALVLGTGDLSELCLGWSTYGGDTVAHYNPNGGVTKTAMRFVIKYLADSLGYPAASEVLMDVLSTPISPELLENQQTERLIGSYEVHDFFIHCLIQKGYDVEKTLYLATRAFRDMQRRDLFEILKTFVNRFFRFRFKHLYSCESPSVISEDLLGLLTCMRSGFSPEQWIKELNNLNV